MPTILSVGARGYLVRELQRKIDVKVDGDYGANTTRALKVAQGANSLPVTGVCDDISWVRIVGRSAPDLFERCLNLTSCFEGHGYTHAAGNWDGAGLTWGIIGFTIKSGSLFSVLAKCRPETLEKHLGKALHADVIEISKRLQSARIAWGDSLSDPRDKRKIKADVFQRFQSLGNDPECQAAQREVAKESYWLPACRALKALPDLTHSERGYALAFDRHVQQGRLLPAALDAARTAAPDGIQAMLDALADGQAVGRWAADIRSRTTTIAKGSGVVHGRRYELASFGIHS